MSQKVPDGKLFLGPQLKFNLQSKTHGVLPKNPVSLLLGLYDNLIHTFVVVTTNHFHPTQAMVAASHFDILGWTLFWRRINFFIHLHTFMHKIFYARLLIETGMTECVQDQMRSSLYIFSHLQDTGYIIAKCTK